MALFNFEMGINTPSDSLPQLQRGGSTPTSLEAATGNTMWFAYKPAVKVYIPAAKWLAIELYTGIEADITGVWGNLNSDYYKKNRKVPEQNYFFGMHGGIGLVFTAIPAIPLEIKTEYRHPLKGNTAIVPQGFYLSAQLHLAAPLHKNKDKH